MFRGSLMAGEAPARSENGERPAEWQPLPDNEFKDQLALVIPHLRAFGRSLSGSRDLADDLVQETLLKAWAARRRFQAGTNMRAWTFIILRNLFLSQMRRARFKGEWDELTASKLLAAPASQDKHIELGDMQRALLHLPQPQREALILVAPAASPMRRRPRFAVARSARSRAGSPAVGSRSKACSRTAICLRAAATTPPATRAPCRPS
jgi:RNA polymerase sigma factor (sigma-70 family)